MATAFHHVHIKSKDPHATVAWWVDMFGAVPKPEFRFGTMHFTPVELDGVTINITGHAPEEAEGMAEPQPIPYWGLEHIGLQVDDMDGIYRDLVGKGVRETARPGQIRDRICGCARRSCSGVAIPSRRLKPSGGSR